jgi:flagellar protein FlaG
MDVKIGGPGASLSYSQPASGSFKGQDSNSELQEAAVRPTSSGNQSQPAREELQDQVDMLNKLLNKSGSHVKFVLHDGLNEYYVQIVNDKTNEVIREIPSKKMMDTVAKMYELIGLLVDEKR